MTLIIKCKRKIHGVFKSACFICSFCLALCFASGLNWIQLIIKDLHLYFNPVVFWRAGKCG